MQTFFTRGTRHVKKNRLSLHDESVVTASKYLNGLEKIGILQSRKIWKATLSINTELFELLKK